jgi:flagellar hook protein FlgE
MQHLSDKISASKLLSGSVDNDGKLTVTSMLPGREIVVMDAKIINGSTPAFPAPAINTTPAVNGNGKAKLEAIELALKTAIENADAQYLRVSSVVDATNLETKTVDKIQMRLDSLKISDNAFGTVEVDNGAIYIKQGDNRFVVGKVLTAVFANELGLEPKGNNVYSSTTDSGKAIYAKNNKILGKTLELSNSELSENLVNLMVFQRSFEASSKAVTTSDEFLKTAIQLKK